MPAEEGEPVHHIDPTPTSMIERMTLILDAFDASTRSLSLVGLAERTGLPRSTVHRILDQMVGLRWLTHSAGGYSLGIRALEIGGLAAGHNEIREVVYPLLHELSHRTGMVAHLAVLERREVVYLDKVGGQLAARLPSRLGGRMPAHATAVGKAMLSSLPPEVVNTTFGARLPVLTPHTIGSLDTLRRELDRIRDRRGIAVDREEALPGIACVAAPLGGSGPIAALSLCGDAHGLNLDRAAHAVLEVASMAGHQLRRHSSRPAG